MGAGRGWSGISAATGSMTSTWSGAAASKVTSNTRPAAWMQPAPGTRLATTGIPLLTGQPWWGPVGLATGAAAAAFALVYFNPWLYLAIAIVINTGFSGLSASIWASCAPDDSCCRVTVLRL